MLSLIAMKYDERTLQNGTGTPQMATCSSFCREDETFQQTLVVLTSTPVIVALL